jgi:hypothetical protein
MPTDPKQVEADPTRDEQDPLHVLTVNPFCEFPDVKELSSQQQCALHEFFHTLLAAGYKLYQTVPQDKAAVILRRKFALVGLRPE